MRISQERSMKSRSRSSAEFVENHLNNERVVGQNSLRWS
jgi:hypothetical protein